MSNQFIGEIRIVGFNFAPVGWAICNGALMPIAGNEALFSLVGTTYGGDGQTTFGLPDMQGRIPIHQGQGPGLSNRVLGEKAGAESVSLTAPQIPAHSHPVNASTVSAGAVASPAGQVWCANGNTAAAQFAAASATPKVPMAAPMVASTGSSLPHNNLAPFLVMNFVICLEGIYPTRN
jgi:microcystin-dependent protein